MGLEAGRHHKNCEVQICDEMAMSCYVRCIQLAYGLSFCRVLVMQSREAHFDVRAICNRILMRWYVILSAQTMWEVHSGFRTQQIMYYQNDNIGDRMPC